ncbi:MAG: hypothetical protein LBU77_06750, partial [Clostridiales bacterium]|nr:hypothetical protein [Clostridiales bacterium]
MNDLLIVRERIIRFYKRYETVIHFMLKFALGLMTFLMVNGIGHYREEFAPLFRAPFHFPFLMLMTLLFVILPPSLANLLVGMAVVLQLSQSAEIAFFVFLAFVLITVFYSRISPKRSYLILAVVLGFHFNLQFAVVLFAGLYCGLFSIIPVAIGVFIWSLTPGILKLLSDAGNMASMLEDMDIMGLVGGFLDTYRALFELVTGDFEWIFTAFIFAMMIVAVYAVSRLAIDYSKDIALGVGAIVGILGFVIGNMITAVSYSILAALFLMLLALGIVEIIKFFDSVLNFEKAERVQFEDEENYYYVKIIPKVIMDDAAPESERYPTTPVPVMRRKPAHAEGAERKTPPPAVQRRLLADDVLEEPESWAFG